MTDRDLIARLRGYIGKASFATGADRYTVTTLLDEVAAALASEQEAQPAAQEPSDEQFVYVSALRHLFAGLLFDFGGFLTTHERRWVFSSHDDAAACVEAVQQFAALRGLSLDDPSIHTWNTLAAQPAAQEPKP